LEKEIDKKLTDFMLKVEYKLKTIEGSVYKNCMAELEDRKTEGSCDSS